MDIMSIQPELQDVLGAGRPCARGAIQGARVLEGSQGPATAVSLSHADRLFDVTAAITSIHSHLRYGPIPLEIVMDAGAKRLLQIGEAESASTLTGCESARPNDRHYGTKPVRWLRNSAEISTLDSGRARCCGGQGADTYEPIELQAVHDGNQPVGPPDRVHEPPAD